MSITCCSYFLLGLFGGRLLFVGRDVLELADVDVGVEIDLRLHRLLLRLVGGIRVVFALDRLVGGLAVRLADAREVDAELLRGAQEVVVLVGHLGALALLGDDVDVERQRLHLLEEHLERLRDARLGDVLALDDGLVGLHAPDGVVGLDREHLLERVRGAVRLERPDLHLAEALAAELRLAAQRLLGDERVRAGRAGVDLVVDQVQQLQDVHVADGHLLLERLAGAAVEERELARGLAALGTRLVDVHADLAAGLLVVLLPAQEGVVDVLDGGTVEHRGGGVDAVAVLEALVAVVVPALRGGPPEVGLQDLADVHARRDAERVQDDIDGRAVLEERHVLLVDDLRDDALVAVAAGELVALGDLALLGDEDADEVVDPGRQVVAVLARERLDVDDDAALAVGHLERGVADLARLLLEDRADQLLLGRQLGLALRRDLADQQVARPDLGADAHDAAVVEVAQRLLRAVRDVAGDLLVAQLRRAGVDLVLLDVDRGELVVLHEAARKDDRVLEVVALPGHEGDHQVLAQRHLAVVGGGAVREDCAGLHDLARPHERLLVDERALVGAAELVQAVLLHPAVALDRDRLGVDEGDRPRLTGQEDVAGVGRRAALHAGAHDGGVGLQERHGLALHVRAHERAVGVVVLEERDHRRRDRPDLLGRDVHEVDLVGRHRHVLTGLRAADDLVADEVALVVELGVRLRDAQRLLLRGVEVDDLVADLAVDDLAVRGRDEAVLGDLREARQRAHEADVRT